LTGAIVIHVRVFVSLLLLLCAATAARAEVLIRWDRNEVPAPESLGISTLVVPGTNKAAVRSALAHGYRLFIEIDATTLTSGASDHGPTRKDTDLPEGLAGVVVRGQASASQLLRLRQRLKSPRARVLTLDERGKWPHIRSNWVTKNKDVLQVSSRTAQPWIENNGALLRIASAAHPGTTPLLTYKWEPITLSEMDEGPALENYLVAIAEAGSFGGDLLLPLHERFQNSLLLGQPQARAGWNEIRRYMEFYSWGLATRYRPIANIGVVTAEPMRWFEAMNLLLRHNLPFEVIAPSKLAARDLTSLDLLIVLDGKGGSPVGPVAEFAKKGDRVIEGEKESLKALSDPNGFAFDVRRALGREQRVIDIWNGITVLAAPFAEPGGDTVLLTVLNYAYQPLPVQLRVRGTFSQVHYESPEDAAALVPHEHREGYTELVLPALRIGGRVFLSGKAR
jgi:hypothetical protein